MWESKDPWVGELNILRCLKCKFKVHNICVLNVNIYAEYSPLYVVKTVFVGGWIKRNLRLHVSKFSGKFLFVIVV